MEKFLKILKFTILPITFVLLALFIIIQFTAETWVYDLPNGYKLRKLTNQNVILGVEIDDDFYTTYQKEQVGITDYIAEFQYNSDCIGVKVLENKKDTTSVTFYLVDTKARKIRGPYEDESTYLAASSVWTSESLGNWMTTTEAPGGAYFK